jgi:glycosyltransferase involved in cell wall biosynthesis
VINKKGGVAFISFGIGDIAGGGGAERFFSDLYDYYHKKERKFELHWILDDVTRKSLKSANKLVTNKSLHRLKIFSNRFKSRLENIQLLYYIIFYRFKIIHVPFYNFYYLPYLEFLQSLPKIIRPKISINIVDHTMPFCYLDPKEPRHLEIVKTYQPLFKNIKVDGYIAWNKSFVDFVREHGVIMPLPALYSIKSRFCDTGRYIPASEKRNEIVFASRMVHYKRPDWFVLAVNHVNTVRPELLHGWKLTLCGGGPTKESVLKLAKEKNLENIIDFVVEPNMEKILNHSKCFVSTQDVDNFPSMSMAEAMASGNVIVSRNVGQTDLFVKDNKNGFLAKEDTPEGVGDALIKFLESNDRFEEMSKHSVSQMKEVHTPENFIPQMEEYWESLHKN